MSIVAEMDELRLKLKRFHSDVVGDAETARLSQRCLQNKRIE
jgi:hypothetical protein